ncbi:helix-turn-helix domain-containing protein [Streptomyces silvisoli]|uniref:Helix-turn-helix domain-containing protein n=1 Tax=Streptomyces silvisoli TaxID=3034235 RepID=A0ABT5ZSS0_9ACTN|nr:helix-turn-helix domain-containing protein [Streptomyces silvisoli]MDF3292701.1 helix-turn-helix domain-containing protein [Streptomyces silvisoli]
MALTRSAMFLASCAQQTKGGEMGWAELQTTDVPKAERFGWWRDLLMQDLAPAHIASEHRDDFPASTAALELGPVNVSVLSFPTLTAVRTPQLIRRSDPELWELGYMASGIMVLEQARSHAQVGAGDLLLYDTSRPVQMRVTEGGRMTILHLPKPAVPLPDRSMRDLLSRRLPTHGSGALLAGFLQGLAGGQWSGLEAERLGSAAVQLASAFLGGLADREGLLPPETRQTVLLHGVKAFIEAHLMDHHLSPQTVADAHGISVRYLHHLFRGEKQTVSAFIRELRLERCRTDLTQPCLAKHPVRAIGARWGFEDAAVFSRAFKAAFGMPPGEYRRLLGVRRSPCDNP